MTVAIAAVLVGLTVALVVPRGSDRRLQALLGAGRGPGAGPRRPAGTERPGRWAAALAALGMWALVGGLAGLFFAIGAGAAAHRALSAATARSAAAPDAALLADAPLAFDLLAACIAAGAAPESALSGVAEAVGGPLGRLLHQVSRAMLLGCPAEQAWAPLLAEETPGLLRLASAGFVRAQRSGAALAPALVTIAAEQRQARRVAAQAAARRVGVLAVAPLGVCFLPAFVLVGVVPLVAGLIGEVAL